MVFNCLLDITPMMVCKHAPIALTCDKLQSEFKEITVQKGNHLTYVGMNIDRLRDGSINLSVPKLTDAIREVVDGSGNSYIVA